MSFFGFEEKDLEREKQKCQEASFEEEVPVFTWGEESYDGLGNALQEGGDELNSETFGNVGVVGAFSFPVIPNGIALRLMPTGKDFDFSSVALPKFDRPLKEQAIPLQSFSEKAVLDTKTNLQNRAHLDVTTLDHDQPSMIINLQHINGSDYDAPPNLALTSVNKTESMWGNKSPFAVLPRANGGFNRAKAAVSSTPPVESGVTPLLPVGQHRESPVFYAGVRTVEEIEAEMRAAVQHSRERQKEIFLQQQMQQEEEERQRILQEQELQRQSLFQQEQHQLHMQRLLQHQREQQYQRTPPPRMLPTSQSPRFLEQQRQHLLLQQHQEQQLQQQRIQEQIRIDEMERQLLARAAIQQRRQSPNPAMLRHRQSSGLSSSDAFGHQHRRQESQSPSNSNHRYSTALQEGLVLPTPQNIQLQQRLLSEMAQVEFIRNVQSGNPHAVIEQEALRMEAMRKILETEQMEEKRRRKAAKIAHMVS